MKVLFPAILVVYSIFGVSDYQLAFENRCAPNQERKTQAEANSPDLRFFQDERCWRLEQPRFPDDPLLDFRHPADPPPSGFPHGLPRQGVERDNQTNRGAVWRLVRCRCFEPALRVKPPLQLSFR